MTPKTLRRKLQKKRKHRKYGRCQLCGNRTRRRIIVNDKGEYKLIEECRDARDSKELWKRVCFNRVEMAWTGKKG